MLRTSRAEGKISWVEASTGTTEVYIEGVLQALLDWTALMRNLREKPLEGQNHRAGYSEEGIWDTGQAKLCMLVFKQVHILCGFRNELCNKTQAHI